jgi:hypothetical protein
VPQQLCSGRTEPDYLDDAAHPITLITSTLQPAQLQRPPHLQRCHPDAQQTQRMATDGRTADRSVTTHPGRRIRAGSSHRTHSRRVDGVPCPYSEGLGLPRRRIRGPVHLHVHPGSRAELAFADVVDSRQPEPALDRRNSMYWRQFRSVHRPCRTEPGPDSTGSAPHQREFQPVTKAGSPRRRSTESLGDL